MIIAGPNGAGKTAFAREFLSKETEVVHFVNPDLIASGLSPLRPDAEPAIRALRPAPCARTSRLVQLRSPGALCGRLALCFPVFLVRNPQNSVDCC
jgi:predicted ABC-type ATPase